jgi:polysaccharide export outer membrane protein
MIGVGDVLEIQLAAGLNESDQSTTAARVQQDGTINLPDIGLVNVAGVEAQAAEALIRAEAVRQDLYRNPTVTVSITFQKKNRVQVLGAVKNQGTYELPPNTSDVVSALAAAGGLKENAGQYIEVRDPSGRLRSPESDFVGDAETPATNVSSTKEETGLVTSYRIDLIDAAKSGEGRYLVPDGGIVMVEQRDPAPIFVQGLVKTPNRYDVPIGKDLRLLDAISLAGGMSNQLADKIFVIRQEPGKQEPLLIQISYRRAKRSSDANIRLGPGDVVSVEHTPGTVFMDALNIIRFGVTGSTTLF